MKFNLIVPMFTVTFFLTGCFEGIQMSDSCASDNCDQPSGDSAPPPPLNSESFTFKPYDYEAISRLLTNTFQISEELLSYDDEDSDEQLTSRQYLDRHKELFQSSDYSVISHLKLITLISKACSETSRNVFTSDNLQGMANLLLNRDLSLDEITLMNSSVSQFNDENLASCRILAVLPESLSSIQ